MNNIWKNSIYFLIVLGLGHISMNAHAIGSAGCGLGSIIFTGNQWWKQLLAVTTNDSFGSQTFGITTGTSNCASGIFGELQKQEDYMVANFASLQREIAQGSGDTVDGLASVLGCQTSSYSDFATYAQSNYEKIFNTEDPKTALINLKFEIKNENKLSETCPLANI